MSRQRSREKVGSKARKKPPTAAQWKRETAFPKSDASYWREHLLLRRYQFPGSGHAAGDFAVQIEHQGTAYFFPLGTPDADKAAAKAREIYFKVVECGWEPVCQAFSRELIVGLEWSVNPLIWTYTTIHTLMGNNAKVATADHQSGKDIQRVLIMEPDPGILAALCWCIGQHPGFSAIAGDPAEPRVALDRHNPSMILVNRNSEAGLGFADVSPAIPGKPGLPVIRYSVCPDGDRLFMSTPGGSQGYFLKRVRAERLLEPIMEMVSRAPVSADGLLGRVKTYFKELLRSHADPDISGLNKLTRRESEVLVLLSRGCVDKEIAQLLNISVWTVHGHIKSIFERLQVRTRTEAVVRYLEK